MTQVRNIAIASTFALITGLALFAQTGSASAKNVLSCEGGSRRSLVECCETAVKKNGLPLWMRQTGRNCATAAVKCSSSHGRQARAVSIKRCHYYQEFEQLGGGNKKQPEDKGRRGDGGSQGPQ